MKVTFIKTKQTYLRISYCPERNIIISLCECSMQELNKAIEELKSLVISNFELYFDDNYDNAFIAIIEDTIEKIHKNEYTDLDNSHNELLAIPQENQQNEMPSQQNRFYIIEPNDNLDTMISQIEARLMQHPTDEYLIKKILNYSKINRIDITKKNIRFICHECGIVLTQTLHEILSKENLLK